MKSIQWLWVLILACAVTPSFDAHGSGPSFGSRKLLGATLWGQAPPGSVVVPAEFVAVTVRISSTRRDDAEAFEETRQGLQLLRAKAKGKYEVSTGTGVVSSDEGYSSGSWKSSSSQSSTDIHLIVQVSTNAWNAFDVGAGAARFLETLAQTGKARFELLRVSLGVSDPEQHRARILKSISEEIKKTRQALAPKGGMRVAGLESPVQIMQVDDKNVALFLDYSLSVSEGEQQGN